MAHSSSRRRAGSDRPTLYQDITDKIIAELEAGRVPWVQPWASAKAPLQMPRNALSGRFYSGINILILWDAVVSRGFSGNAFLTFRQALELGGNVCKGAKGTTIVYAHRFTPGDERRQAAEEGRIPGTIPFLKRFTVFNLDQCDGLPDSYRTAVPPPEPAEILPQAAALIAATGADFRIGGDQAFYNITDDCVCVPPPSRYFEPINWNRTAFHELGHWTGSRTRLDRDQSGAFGSDKYAREELVVRRVGANKGVKTCLLDSWENPCVPDLPVPVMSRLKSRKGNGTIACREKAQTAETIVGRAGHRKVRTAKATLPELQSSGFYPRRRRSDGCNAAPRRDRFATESRSKKRVVLLDTLGPACAACPPSVGSKGRTERLTASHLLVRVNTGSPKWARQRPTWRQSRHSSQMPGVMPRTAICEWTITDESCRATGTGLLTDWVKGGSACETGQPTGWAC